MAQYLRDQALGSENLSVSSCVALGKLYNLSEL